VPLPRSSEAQSDSEVSDESDEDEDDSAEELEKLGKASRGHPSPSSPTSSAFPGRRTDDNHDCVKEEEDLRKLSVEELRLQRGVVCRWVSSQGTEEVADQLTHMPLLSLKDLTERRLSDESIAGCKQCMGPASLASPIQAEVWGASLPPKSSTAALPAPSSTKLRPEDVPLPDSSDDDDDLLLMDPYSPQDLQVGGSSGSRCRVDSSFDLIGVAPTGSGKTLAFLVPLLAAGGCMEPTRILQLPALSSRLRSTFQSAFPDDRGRNAALLDRLCQLCQQGNHSTLRPAVEQIAQKASGGKGLVSPVWRQLLDDIDAVGLLEPRALVLSPTRELAQQVGEVAEKLGAASMVILGGVDHVQQRESLLHDCPALLVATPGRLLALCGKWSSTARSRKSDAQQAADLPEPAIRLRHVDRLVLDEADRLLDEGFESDILAIAGLTSPARRTSLFSATWSAATEALAKAVALKERSLFVRVSGVPSTITQQVEVLPKAARGKRLREILFGELPKQSKVLLFVLFKKEAKELARMLTSEGILAYPLEGGMSQAARTMAMQSFRSAPSSGRAVLVATDVAARGLDVPDVTHVINFSFGSSSENYVHRIGRCGRAGRSGKAITFVTDGDQKFSEYLVQVLTEARQPVPKALVDMASLFKQSYGLAKLIVQWDKAGEPRVVAKDARTLLNDEDGGDSSEGVARKNPNKAMFRGKGSQHSNKTRSDRHR